MKSVTLALLASMALAAVSCTATQTAHPDVAATNAKAAERSPAKPIVRRTGYAVASDGARIYYEHCGAGPAIVFVHGLGGNHAVWFQQVAHFAKDHTVVTISQRGFAPSGGDQKHYDVRLLVEDLRAVMKAAGVERAVVVGQSMGGWTALAMALSHPEQVEALVLADTLGGIHDDEIAQHMREVGRSAAQLRAEPPPVGVHPALGAKFSREKPEMGYLYQTLSSFGSPAPDSIVKQLGATHVLPAELAGLRLPALFVVGSEDDLFPPKLIEKAASYIHGARVAVLPDAGHSPYFETPEAWNAAVEGFLAAR
jgi:pimeloyl-ACP methyl ester carboxylesterase